MKRLLGMLLVLSLFMGLSAIPGYSASAAGSQQILRIGYGELPVSADPALAADPASSTVMKGLFEGLVRLDSSGQAVPGIANAWKISADGKTYTFTLRSDAKWSNQDSVTALDFEYSWKRALAPEARSIYAFNMFPIVNAEAYNAGKLKDASKVGVKALNSYTLQVTLKEKTAYFIQMLAENIYAPVNPAVAKANKNWASYIKTMVTNGPFTVKSWNKNSIVLVKNPKYYAASEIKFSEVQLFRPKAGTDNTTAAFLKNQIDWTGGNEKLDYAALYTAGQQQIYEMPVGSTYYYQFNMHEAPFDNVKIRKALAMAIDREGLKYGSPAFGFIPPAIRSTDLNFRAEVADTEFFKENVALAQLLLQEGLKEEGLTELPEFTVIINEGEGHQFIAASILKDWSDNLGIEANIDIQSTQEVQANKYSQNFTIARAGWTADYNDPAAMMELFTSSNVNNDSGWSDSQYDSYVAQAKLTSDPDKRLELYAKAEKLLIDQMVIIPLYYYVSDVLHKPGIQNVYHNYDGSIAFTRGYFK